MKTKNVNKWLHVNYLKKANEFYDTAKNEFERKNWNSCVLNAIHCAICAADALTIAFKGIRHAGERHEDVVKLFQELDMDTKVLKDKTKQLLALLDVKNSTEYEEKLTTENGASIALENAERFFEWVGEQLKSES